MSYLVYLGVFSSINALLRLFNTQLFENLAVTVEIEIKAVTDPNYADC